MIGREYELYSEGQPPGKKVESFPKASPKFFAGQEGFKETGGRYSVSCVQWPVTFLTPCRFNGAYLQLLDVMSVLEGCTRGLISVL